MKDYMMLVTLVVSVIFAVMLSVSCVYASDIQANASTQISAQISDYVTIDAPDAYSWNLTPFNDNEKTLPTNVTVTSNTPWDLQIDASNNGYMQDSSNKPYLQPMKVKTPTSWATLSGNKTSIHSGIPGSNIGVPITLKQPITVEATDPSSIWLTFTVIVV
jgi:hypothetical protein